MQFEEKTLPVSFPSSARKPACREQAIIAGMYAVLIPEYEWRNFQQDHDAST